MATLFSRFRRPDPKYSGAWRMPESAKSIAHARRLRAGNPWPARVHGLLTAGLAMALVSIITGIWLAVLCCTGSDSVRSEGCFTAALWACGAFVALILAKVIWNSKYPKH